MFILAGTVVNLLLALICIGLLLVVANMFSRIFNIPATTLDPFAFVGGIIISIFSYQRLTLWVITKFNLTDKLEPFFTAQHKKKTR